MNETQRLALTAAFMAAVVVAGLSLSYVPHVELVTLVVFASGVVLGWRRGAWVGAVGMLLYVFANTALKGFPPSPVPILAAQAVGMAVPGAVGGVWRSLWRSRYRRAALWVLPVLGFLLAAFYQVLLNGAYAAFLMSRETGPRLGVFLSGLSFGLLDMVWNGIMFALAGPPVLAGLRRMARSRGWWGPAAAVWILAASAPEAAPAQVEVSDSLRTSGAADTLAADTTATMPALPDSAGSETASADTTAVNTSLDSLAASAERPRRPRARRWSSTVPVLWREFSVKTVSEAGVPGLFSGDPLSASEISRVTTPGLPAAVDRWAFGWGRTRITYDGIPLAGPVHGFDDPPDLPLAWKGRWMEKRTGTGTTVDVGLPAKPEEPVSQISLTTGSLGRRTSEFGLFRNLGSTLLGVDFADREESGRVELSTLETSRVWTHLSAPPDRRTRWTLDVSTAVESRNRFSVLGGGEMGRDARRIQGSVIHPVLGGDTRLAIQLRRLALQYEGNIEEFGEILFDGYTIQGGWAGTGNIPVRLQAQLDHERRRGGFLPEDTFDGFRGSAGGSVGSGPWSLGVEGLLGWQDPYGFTWGGSAVLAWEKDSLRVEVSVAHDEDLPPMVLSVDRPTPESGIGEHLVEYETVQEPEQRSAVRVETAWRTTRFRITGGGWAGRQRFYRLDANPVWSPFTQFAPLDYPANRADVLGVYAQMRLDLGKGFYAAGGGRIHDRNLREVPYATRWFVDGALHWKRPWFNRSMLVDASLGGTVLGPRENPNQERYPEVAYGYFALSGRVDNGVVTVTLENLADGYFESDLRSDDTVTPLSIPGRTLTVGLTMYLSH